MLRENYNRFEVVQVTPENAEALGFESADVGLKLYLDGEWHTDVDSLSEAKALIRQECGVRTRLIGAAADSSWRWTPHPFEVQW